MAATSETDLAPDIPDEVRDAATFFQRHRPLFWVALAWMSGILIDDALNLPFAYTLATIAVAIGLATLLVFLTQGLRRELCVLAIFAFATGIGTHAFVARILPENHIARITQEAENPIDLQGVVRDVSRLQSGSARWTLRVESVSNAKNPTRLWTPASGLVQLFVPRAPTSISEASRVAVRVLLRKPIDTFPDDFDLVAYLHREGIYRTGVVDAAAEIEILPPSYNPILALRRFSGLCSERLTQSMPAWDLEGRAHGSQVALLNALLFGRKEFLDRADRDAFTATGTAHLLAISGLQIQFLAWLLWMILRRAGTRTTTSAATLFLATWLYVALTGAEPPIVRAAVMISLALFGRVVWREVDPLSLLGASAICILAAAPDQLFQAGFQLSYCAVFSLVTLGPLFKELINKRGNLQILEPVTTAGVAPRGIREEFSQVALISFVAWLGTLPVIAWHMQQFSILGVFTNLIAVPLSTLAMIAALLTLAAGIISTALAAPFAWAAFSLIALLQLLTENVAQLPIASMRVPAPHPAVLFFFCLLVAFLWIERGRRSTRRLSLALTVLLAVIVSAPAFFIEPAPASITLLDLPRSRAVLIQEGPDAVLIDTGGPSSANRLAQWIQNQGVKRLRKIIVTEDEWGTFGGVTELARRFPIEEVVLPVCASPDVRRRELEADLNARKIPWTSRPASEPTQLLPSFRFQLSDDADSSTPKIQTETAIAVRIEQGTHTLLVLPARSMASLERFQKNAPAGFLIAPSLFLPAGPFNRFPRTAQALIEKSGCENFISTATPAFPIQSPNHRRTLLLPYGSARIVTRDNAASFEMFVDGLWLPK